MMLLCCSSYSRGASGFAASRGSRNTGRSSDLKSTPLNSNLPSSPTRRSSDLPIRVSLLEHDVAVLLLVQSWRFRFRRIPRVEEYWQELRSQKHTSQLQSPLFPYTTLFRSPHTSKSAGT